ncbi:potassium channel family protein [Streptomyces sp. KL118A]|uniref:potassium channel family protein n=1 Tax=Streptomyces sp. KL118A TaxID=3045153 RepID=UPI00278BDA80|nr:potassium channel family protein [Streptomyces sp. KL118A]
MIDESRIDESRKARWENRAEVPLAVASMLFLAAYAVRVLAHGLPAPWRHVCLAVALAAWAVFAVDYAVRWRLSGRRLGFVRKHWLDTVILLLPLLRPLRFVRTYETIQRRHARPRLALHARVALYSGLSVLLLGFAGALAVYHQEHGAPGATIRGFGDAVWWTCATLATVGYGDVAPVTPVGRLVAVGLMGCGLALLGAVTGSFSSWLLQVFAREGDAPTRERNGGQDDGRPPGSDSPGAS